MIKLIFYCAVIISVVKSQAHNGIIWDNQQPEHQQPQQHSMTPQHVHEHLREANQQDEHLLGTPLIGLKLAKPFMFGIPGLRYSNINMGHLGGFNFANSILGAENPHAAEQETMGYNAQLGTPMNYQAEENLAAHHHHHHFQDSQLGNAHQYQAQPQQLQAEAPQHYAPYHVNVGASPCQQNYNLGAPADAFAQPMGPMMPIIQPLFQPAPMIQPPHPMQAEPEQRTWGKGYGG